MPPALLSARACPRRVASLSIRALRSGVACGDGFFRVASGRSPPLSTGAARFVAGSAHAFVEAEMARIVLKFGGTSVGDIDRIKNVARTVKKEVDQGHQVAVV